MTSIIDWASNRARMVLAFIVLSLLAGGLAYSGLPKEGEPDIEIPALFISVVFPGISAADSEAMLIKPMETELADLDSLKKMSATAAENYAGLALEFEFGWNKTKVMADVRDAMSNAEEQFPEGVEKYSINEINFSEFPIIIVNLTGQVPERTMSRIARDLQEKLERNDAVLQAGIAGSRDEMLEVLIDPLRLEAYNVTAGELISVVQNNNQLIAAGDVKTAQGSFSIKIPSSFKEVADVYALPVKTNGDRVVTLDGGIQKIRWIGSSRPIAKGRDAPIHFSANAIGNHHAVTFSQNHRVLIRDALAELLFGTTEVLVKAKDLVNDHSIRRIESDEPTHYVHMMFDQHEIVFANGMPSESYHPGPQTLPGFDAETQAEILRLMPNAADEIDYGYGPAARAVLKKHECAVLRQYIELRQTSHTAPNKNTLH